MLELLERENSSDIELSIQFVERQWLRGIIKCREMLFVVTYRQAWGSDQSKQGINRPSCFLKVETLQCVFFYRAIGTLSVRLSVCPSRSGIVSKRLNVSSQFLHHTSLHLRRSLQNRTSRHTVQKQHSRRETVRHSVR